jgi:hypothetical protein
VKIVKNERDPPLFTGKLVIKFQNILRNTPVKRGESLSFLVGTISNILVVGNRLDRCGEWGVYLSELCSQ